MRTLIAIGLLCSSVAANAACPVQKPREMPALPDGGRVEAGEMLAAQLAADQYRLQAQAYMDCRVMNRRQHNQLLTQVEMYLEAFNTELLEFQARDNMLAEN